MTSEESNCLNVINGSEFQSQIPSNTLIIKDELLDEIDYQNLPKNQFYVNSQLVKEEYDSYSNLSMFTSTSYECENRIDNTDFIKIECWDVDDVKHDSVILPDSFIQYNAESISDSDSYYSTVDNIEIENKNICQSEDIKTPRFCDSEQMISESNLFTDKYDEILPFNQSNNSYLNKEENDSTTFPVSMVEAEDNAREQNICQDESAQSFCVNKNNSESNSVEIKNEESESQIDELDSKTNSINITIEYVGMSQFCDDRSSLLNFSMKDHLNITEINSASIYSQTSGHNSSNAVILSGSMKQILPSLDANLIKENIEVKQYNNTVEISVCAVEPLNETFKGLYLPSTNKDKVCALDEQILNQSQQDIVIPKNSLTNTSTISLQNKVNDDTDISIQENTNINITKNKKHNDYNSKRSDNIYDEEIKDKNVNLETREETSVEDSAKISVQNTDDISWEVVPINRTIEVVFLSPTNTDKNKLDQPNKTLNQNEQGEINLKKTLQNNEILIQEQSNKSLEENSKHNDLTSDKNSNINDQNIVCKSINLENNELFVKYLAKENIQSKTNTVTENTFLNIDINSLTPMNEQQEPWWVRKTVDDPIDPEFDEFINTDVHYCANIKTTVNEIECFDSYVINNKGPMYLLICDIVRLKISKYKTTNTQDTWYELYNHIFNTVMFYGKVIEVKKLKKYNMYTIDDGTGAIKVKYNHMTKKIKTTLNEINSIEADLAFAKTKGLPNMLPDSKSGLLAEECIEVMNKLSVIIKQRIKNSLKELEIGDRVYVLGPPYHYKDSDEWNVYAFNMELDDTNGATEMFWKKFIVLIYEELYLKSLNNVDT